MATFSLVVIGCGNENGVGNPYYDRIGKLANEAKENPDDKTALRKLEKYTSDPDYWNRFYAYGSLGELASQNTGGCQAELIPYFDNALKDSDGAIRRAGAEAILDIGSPAVETNLSTLLNIVQQGREDDVTWYAAEALGQLKDQEKVQVVLAVLLKAANKPPAEGTPDEAPQVRYYALGSIKELAKMNKVNAIPDLETILKESKFPYSGHVAKAILELDPTNRTVQQFMKGVTQ